MALIHEMRAAQASESTGNPTDMFLVSMARQNFTALLNAVQKMEQYWAGANYVASLLEKRESRNVISGFLSISARFIFLLHTSSVCYKQVVVAPPCGLTGAEADTDSVGSGFNRSKTKANKKTFISLPDKGLLRRFTADPSHPNNVGPATETSLRESIAKSSGSGPSEWTVHYIQGLMLISECMC
jgi:hypothetical protein